MISLVVLLAAADPFLLIERASDRLSVRPAEAPAASFRVAREQADAPSHKDRALREDGGKCAVVGARMCTRPPRTMLSTAW